MSNSKIGRGIASILGSKVTDQKEKKGFLNLSDDSPSEPVEKENAIESLDDEPAAPTQTGDENVKPIISGQLRGVKEIRELISKKGNADTRLRLGRNTIFISPSLVRSRPFFNVRYDMGDVPGLAQSILENGQREPIKVDLLEENGEIIAYVTDGYRRMAAINYLIQEGHQVLEVECFVNPTKIKEEDRIKLMFISQDNKKLEDLEVGRIFKRMTNLGWSKERIAKHFGKSDGFVREKIILAEEPEDLQQLLIEKKVTGTALIELRRKEPDALKRRDLVISMLSKQGGFTTTDVRGGVSKRSSAVEKKVKKEKVSTDVEKLGSEIFGPLLWHYLDLIDQFKKGDVSAKEVSSKLLILHEQPANPVGIAARLDLFKNHLIKFYGPATQDQLGILVGYLEGTKDEESLVDIGDRTEAN